MAEDSGSEKTEEPTQRRKDEARKKGTVTKSTDLVGALVLFSLALVVPAAFSKMGNGFLSGFRMTGFAEPTQISTEVIFRLTMSVLQPVLGGLIMIVGTVMPVGILANVAQVGFHLSGEALTPSLKKLNPLEGFKRIFSKKAGFEGLKAFAKATLFGLIAYRAVSSHWNEIVGFGWVGAEASVGALGAILLTTLKQIAMVWLVMAIIDYGFQKKQTNQQLKMTKDELKREMKEQEGSPEVKQERYKRSRKLARGRMQQQVQQADVIITNPTHFAIAIKYDRSEMYAPMVVAKGQDLLAFRIREIAKEAKVAIVENPPLARALYKQCEVGDFVPRDLFLAVAEVLAYVYKTISKIR